MTRLLEITSPFDGKHLHIEQASFKLFPYMMRGMYQFPPFAVTDIAFRVTDKTLKLCFFKEQSKREQNKKEQSKKDKEQGNRISKQDNLKQEKLIVKAGFAKYYNQRITIGPNDISLAAKAYLSTDEDGNSVIQLDMVFPATGFSRKIKFFLLEDRISIECMEYPDMRAIVDQVIYGETVLAGNAIDLTGKLPEGLRVLMEHKVEPKVNGVWVE